MCFIQSIVSSEESANHFFVNEWTLAKFLKYVLTFHHMGFPEDWNMLLRQKKRCSWLNSIYLLKAMTKTFQPEFFVCSLLKIY